MTETSSYRPHDPGHDYYAPGIYLITLVVRKRKENLHMFGSLNKDLKHPDVELNELGKAVMRCWEEIPERQAKHGRKVIVHTAICMPEHFHGVIEVKERMDVSLGEVIRGFKAGCTMAWRAFMRNGSEGQRPSMVVDTNMGIDAIMSTGTAIGDNKAVAQPYLDEQEEREMLKRMSKKQRAAYYAQHPEAQQPLWDDNYDDTICLSDPETGEYCQRHFTAMIRYVNDNARRAIIRILRPEFMQRCLHVRIADRDYAAFGNLFLLRWARKVQVFCHRKARYGMLTDEERKGAGYTYEMIDDAVTRVPYEETEAYRREAADWESLVMAGQTVIVTPGISRGEQQMKDRCMDGGWPLIHLQKEAIGAYWKPEKKRFDACANGRLLILAPWNADELGEVNGAPSSTDYSVFHNLNKLAEEICLFEGDAMILGNGR